MALALEVVVQVKGGIMGYFLAGSVNLESVPIYAQSHICHSSFIIAP